jgi:site-specific recombinase XerD
MRVADCARCGGGVGRKEEVLCHRCRAADREAQRRANCPNCEEFLRLDLTTGRCVRCSRTCADCGHVLRFKSSVRCLACRRRSEAAAAKSPCPRCGRPGYIRPPSGLCGTCARPRPPLPPRPCTACGALKRKKGEGLCHRCWERNPARPVNQAFRLMASLGGPEWLARFAEFAAERHCIARASLMVGAVGRLVRDGGPSQPQALLERSRRPGRSAGALARALEGFFLAEGLAFGLDQEARLAAGRRHRRVEAVPVSLRPAVGAFADHLVRSRERALRAGTRPRKDITIEHNLGIVRDLARFLATERSKQEWAMVAVDDIEAFLGAQPANRRRRLQASRQFFGWARKNKLVLVDPTKGLSSLSRWGFAGETLSLSEQRRLFRRWSGADAHPHEALVGILALLHALSNTELRSLQADDFDQARGILRVGHRPVPVPLDPVSASVLRRCLAHRGALGTHNPHIMVTRQTKTRTTPASTAYLSHILDAAGTSTKRLRSTRIVGLVTVMDAKVVGEALGMKPEGLVGYLADHVDVGRLELNE